MDEFAKIAASSGCADLMAFATSAVRDARNSEDVLAQVLAETGVNLQVRSGANESWLTFLTVRPDPVDRRAHPTNVGLMRPAAPVAIARMGSP